MGEAVVVSIGVTKALQGEPDKNIKGKIWSWVPEAQDLEPRFTLTQMFQKVPLGFQKGTRRSRKGSRCLHKSCRRSHKGIKRSQKNHESRFPQYSCLCILLQPGKSSRHHGGPVPLWPAWTKTKYSPSPKTTWPNSRRLEIGASRTQHLVRKN